MATMSNLLEIHDRMVAEAPDGAKCPEDCIFCSGEYASLHEESDMSDTTYTEEDLRNEVAAAVAAATVELQTEIEALKAAAKKKMTGPANDDDADDEKAAFEAQIADLTAKLDAAVAEAASMKEEHEALVSYLEGETARVQEEAERETLKAARIAAVAEVISFPEEHVTARADNWAQLDEEKFEALLADYKLLGEKTKTESTPIPRATAMVSSRDVDTDKSNVGSELRDLIRGRNFGLDPRAIR